MILKFLLFDKNKIKTCKLFFKKNIFNKEFWQKTSPEAPVMSIFLRFLHSKMPTVSFPEVGTYLNEKHMSPKY